MNITLKEVNIPNKLEFYTEIEDDAFLNLSFKYLTDAYELTDLEKHVYQKNNLFIDEEFLDHVTCCDNWFKLESDNINCHHASILYKYSFEKYFNQINKLKKEKKELVRFFEIKSKYGLDFYLQYIDENICCDIIHIENDYFTYDELIEAKKEIQNFILKTDWEDLGINIVNKKNEWEYLYKNDQLDWKARYFDFPKAFLRKK
jgi:hypothetical protein